MFKFQLFLVIFLFLATSTVGLSQSKSEEKMAKKADAHFKKKEYLVAEKFYAQLLANSADNSEYNYKYGACLLTNSSDKQEALKYLKFGVKNASTVGDAHYFYGKALQYSYRFKEALSNFNKFRSAITEAKAAKLEVDAHIQQCKTSIKLIENYTPVKVVSSKVMNDQRFEKAYKLGKMNRRILIKPNDFNTKEDYNVKKGDPQLIVHGQNQKTLFFSGYKYGKRFAILERDIYMVKKSHDGIWTNFLDLGPFINTEFDEDYPYLHPNGRELYFSSKGHGGLGGYDIFKSQLDEVTGLWGRPVNLGFAINSAFDDVLYVTDSAKNVAYFSSNRSNSAKEMTVYKIIPNDNIDNFVLCTGKVIVDREKSNKVNIEVINSDGQLIGKYVSNKKTGEFAFPLAELESYRLKFTYKNEITKSIKLVTPLKSSKDIIYYDITFIVNGVPALETVNDKNYEISDGDKVIAFQNLSQLKVNQKTTVVFGTIDTSGQKSLNDITVTDPESLLKDALLSLKELKLERKELSAQVNAGYVLTHGNTKNAVQLNSDLEQLASNKDKATPKVKEEIIDKQEEYNSSVKSIVDVLLFVENQENLLLQKEKEEAITYAYVEQINEARLGNDVDLVKYRKKMASTIDNFPVKSKIYTVSKEIKSLKNKRSKIQSQQFNIKSEIDLVKDAVIFLTEQMNKTKKDETRLDYAEQITSLEKVKKKKSPIFSENKILLAELDSLLKIKELEVNQYGEVDAQSSQSSMARVNFKERKIIADNARAAVNKSRYAGKLDQFGVKKVVGGSDQSASGNSIFSESTDVQTDEDLETFLASNLNDASDDQIHHFSNDIMGIEQVTDGDFEDEQIQKKEQLAANNFREALMMRQEIEKKKKQLAEATDEDIKKTLREEIKILEDHLFKMEFEAMLALTNSNDLRRKEKNSAIEVAFLLNPGIQTGEIAQLYDQANDDWDKTTMLKQRLANNDSRNEKSELSKKILNKQAAVINKLLKIERLIKGQPTDVEKTIASTEDITKGNNPVETDPDNFWW